MLRHFLNKIQKPEGFSLLETAISMVVVGLIAGSIINYYTQYRVTNDQDTTEDKLESILTELGNYRAIYGRYPCPASSTAYIGDVEYGRELPNCDEILANHCSHDVCAVESPTSGERVVFGTIPFKAMNVQESDTVDAYYSRYFYAVTSRLTDQETFALDGGTIRIEDSAGNSLTNPEDSAHFVVISPGKNKYGSYTNSGASHNDCNDAPAPEKENCDMDTTFVLAPRGTEYDDFIGYNTPITFSQWERTEANLKDISLKYSDAVAVGAQNTSDLSSASTLTLRTTSGTASMYSEEAFFVDNICQKDATDTNSDCFPPRLFAGTLSYDSAEDLYYNATAQTGISCYSPGETNPQYLIGIKNNQAQCADEIFISCPDGQYATAINDGVMKCSEPPADGCEAITVEPTCHAYGLESPETAEIPATYSGGYGYAYSGECRTLPDKYNAGFFYTQAQEMDSYEEMEALIESINAEERIVTDCGSTITTSLVRDSYLCKEGFWNFQKDEDGDGEPDPFAPEDATPIRKHEITNQTSFSKISPTKGAPYLAELNQNHYEDESNTNHNHDCWCREDFSITPMSCTNPNSPGWGFTIRKHQCPRTYHYWQWVASGSYDCTCKPYEKVTTQSCLNYYNAQNGTNYKSGLSGTVYLTHEFTCQGEKNIYNPSPIDVNTDECACTYEGREYKGDKITRTACSEHTTNLWNWTFDGRTTTETGVEEISVQQWICPSTTSNGLPDPGYLESEPSFTQSHSCVCDSEESEYVTEDCPNNYDGGGIKYLKEWNCVTNDWEAEEDWEEVSNTCYPCTWQRDLSQGGTLRSSPNSSYENGTSCSCTDSKGTERCWDSHGDGNYMTYNTCTCKINKD